MTPKHVTQAPLLAATIATLVIIVAAAWPIYSYRQRDASPQLLLPFRKSW
jgi:hypothetical protein